MTDPKPRKDGTCVVCGKKRRRSRSEHKMNAGYTRLNRSVWTFHVERDPFCSMECCRSHYGLPLPTSPSLSTANYGVRRDCVDCGEPLSPNRPAQSGERCRGCADTFKRKRKFNIPGHCAGCGISHEETVGTINCSTCSDRIRRKWRRENLPEVAAREKAWEQARRLRRQQEREAA